MKRILSLLLTAMFAVLTLTACTEPVVYRLDDFIPPLMDIDTQYPYVTEITVTDLAAGDTVAFTEGADHNRIRMQFEELECLRTKDFRAVTEGYAVSFITTNETVTLTIPKEKDTFLSTFVYIGEYEFEVLRMGVDTAFFASLFEE